ncbi:hypothetical protein BCR32DRAFT_106137 [Anaeromyces robustus]|uniref:Uncharacterized protein n=1 Tax=Anaeromyces robustus TaxID=1754192 RepID=A0A1Y1W8E8_9FUNG|nr:hypothetical protein BCR32DRAFT_106137 [Anaeromyces robustus]|eukprot:ORX69811.1 hypothetical protein BCR32DRAFT_106137 [Anaeromyces robustus]
MKKTEKYIIYIYCILLTITQKCLSQLSDNSVKINYLMDIYDINDNPIKRYQLHYNYSTYLFNEYYEIKTLYENKMK